MRRWTEEEKAKQAELIRKWKPWENSTGPRTEHGKKCSSQNSRKYSPFLSHLFTLSRKRRKYQELKEEIRRAEIREEYMRSLLLRLEALERAFARKQQSQQHEEFK